MKPAWGHLAALIPQQDVLKFQAFREGLPSGFFQTGPVALINAFIETDQPNARRCAWTFNHASGVSDESFMNAFHGGTGVEDASLIVSPLSRARKTSERFA